VSTVNAPTSAVPLASTTLRAPAWDRLAPLGIGLLAAVVAFWSLTISGYANTYYSAAAQAAAQSWSAMFYGAIDSAGFITVDKPPVAIWAMGLSVRILGLSPFAVLLPQALAGIGAALVLWAVVRRSFGPAAAVIAGVAFALTPVGALMFRFNNPDALLTLLLVTAAWALVRGLEDDRFRWLGLAAALVGFAFLTKYLQAYLVLPAFALTYLVAARGGLRRRVTGLLLSGAVVFVSSFWWVAIVELVPTSARPYIGGSTNNSALDLILGYDGLGRIFGQGGGPGGGGPGGGPGGGGFGGGFGGATGLLRMFNAQWAGEISWLLPAAAIGLVTGLVARFRAPRTDARRAGYLLWGTWAVVHVAVFSFMGGVVHPYYAVAIAPAAAALTGAGIAELWGLRSRTVLAGIVLGAMLVGTAWWGLQVLGRTPDLLPGVGLGALFVALAAAIVLAVPPVAGDARARFIAGGALVVGLAAALTGPTIYTGTTMAKSLVGGDPAAGPANGVFGGGFGGGLRAGSGGFPGDTAGTNDALAQYLVANRGDATWLVAVSSANQAGPLQLATGAPVMAMGGFMGSDPAPTLGQLRGYIHDGSLRYVLIGGRGGGPGGFFGGDGRGNVANERSSWVQSSCTQVSAPGVSATLYDCAGAG
jgi:4-amino-4-deoxy-L-arabinose transferase-like glycosyltransferase